jgi:molecular chaperone GrpE
MTQEAGQASNSEETQPQEEETIALREALEQAQAQALEHLAGWQRAQADYQNLRRRAEQEREELAKFANAQLILHLLPIADDLERALGSLDAKLASLTWVEGIYLIERKLHAALELMGVSAISAEGQRSTDLHSALL